MARQKGDGKGRLGGRKKGTGNKVNATMREWLTELINDNREQIRADLKELQPAQRLAMLEKFMQYTTPKQSAISSNVNFEQMTDEQIDAFIEKLTMGV